MKPIWKSTKFFAGIITLVTGIVHSLGIDLPPGTIEYFLYLLGSVLLGGSVYKRVNGKNGYP